MPQESADRAIGRLEGKVDLMLSRQGEMHEENTGRWEEVAKVVPIVANHADWIEREGKPAAEASKAARWYIRGALGASGVGLAGGTGLLSKVLVLIGILH